MKQLSSPTRLFLISTYIVGTYFLLYNMNNIKGTDPLLLGGLCLLGSVMHILKVEGATNRSHYTISFLIYGFTLTSLGLPETILVILISNLIEWAWNRTPWYIQLFNISCYVAAVEIAGLISSGINPTGGTTGGGAILAIAAGMAGFTLLNHLLVGIIVWLARGENFKQSGVFDLITLLIDLTMLSVGASMAIVWDYNPYALLIFLIPAYPLYMALKIPALERKTEIDQKTGLFNHHYFMEQLSNELQRANRHDRPLSIIMADLDLLRNINNTYGHLAGDEVLKGIANILKRSVREYDIVARFGGEEFAILMPETEIDKAVERAEFIRKEVESARFTIPTSIDPIKATISLGTSTREDFKQTSEEIIHNADTALYNSKLRGRNQVFACVQNSFTQVQKMDFHVERSEKNISHSNISSSDDEIGYSASIRKYISTDSKKHGSNHAKLATNKLEQETSKPATKPRPTSNKVSIYIAFLALAAIILSSLTFMKQYQSESIVTFHMWSGLVAIVAIIVVTEWFSVDLYVRNTSLSTSAVPLIAGFILFGPYGVMIGSIAYAITATIKYRSPFNRFIFNLSNHIIAGIIINILLVLGEGSSFNLLENKLIRELIYTLVSSIILFFSTTTLLSVGLGIDLEQSPIQIWNEQYKWMTPYYLGIGFIAYSMIFGFGYAGLPGILIMVAPLALLRYSQTQYISHTRDIVDELRKKNLAIEKTSMEINELNEGLLTTLSEIIDLRDPYVLGHSKQVSNYATYIAKLMGLNERQTDLIRRAGLLHDIGKLGIPMDILTKPGKLTKDEYEAVKEHAALGGNLVKNSPSLRPLVSIIRHHHEFYDGNGYPDKLSGNLISIEARIIAVADAMEAMTSDRPYRRALKTDKVKEELLKHSGTQFDPLVIEAAVKVLDRIQESEVEQSTYYENHSCVSPKLAPDAQTT